MKLLCFLVLTTFHAGGLGNDVESRIVGGQVAYDEQFPYQVSLRTSSLSHFCGGSIISENAVLTAALCVHEKYASNVKAVVGTNYLTTSYPNFDISTIKVHELYNPSTYVHNIAVLKTWTRLLSVQKTAIIGLNIASTMPGQVCTLSGWGKQYTSASSFSNELRYATLRVISLDACYKIYYPNQSQGINNDVVCTQGSTAGGCDGDTGSPLVSQNLLIGVMSWGVPCGTGYYPDVFTNVATHGNWILSSIK